MVTSTTVCTVASAACGRGVVIFFIFYLYNLFDSVIVKGAQLNQFDESRYWILREAAPCSKSSIHGGKRIRRPEVNAGNKQERQSSGSRGIIGTTFLIVPRYLLEERKELSFVAAAF